MATVEALGHSLQSDDSNLVRKKGVHSRNDILIWYHVEGEGEREIYTSVHCNILLHGCSDSKTVHSNWPEVM